VRLAALVDDIKNGALPHVDYVRLEVPARIRMSSGCLNSSVKGVDASSATLWQKSAPSAALKLAGIRPRPRPERHSADSRFQGLVRRIGYPL